MWVFLDTTEADTIHPVSVAILYRSDNRPFSTLHMIKIWTYKNQNRTGTAVFIKKKTTETDHRSENGNRHSTIYLYEQIKNQSIN